ncbi:hypothetical protein XpopCFBP1817_20255 [Xanthomonas populi]|uniref:Uncharacterized protein n=1 Tax=Xanthomonas populi TaxID=53414 RepID=A0A2S7E424_9XANT|nr:hypothetical protein XpopCFBP1817_20255 [Xanthomonas populi]
MICSSEKRFFTSNLLGVGNWTPNWSTTRNWGASLKMLEFMRPGALFRPSLTRCQHRLFYGFPPTPSRPRRRRSDGCPPAPHVRNVP